MAGSRVARRLARHRRGQFIAIVGPNGAGKTTCSRRSRCRSAGAGAIAFEGRDLLAVRRMSAPISASPMCPRDGRCSPAYPYRKTRDGRLFEPRQADWQRNIRAIFALFPVLAERRRQLAGTLSGGEQQMLAIGRASPRRRASCCSTSRRWAGAGGGRSDLRPHRALHQEDRVTLILVEQRVARRSNPAITAMCWKPAGSCSKGARRPDGRRPRRRLSGNVT